jgi:hypothetical protein
MANAVLLHVTIDHNVVLTWAQRRGARPATFEGDEHPWPVSFTFGSASSGLKEISWEDFFAAFERADLALVYRDVGPNGELDNLHEFVNRAAVSELIASRNATIAEEVT